MSARRYTKDDLGILMKQGLAAQLPEPKPKKPRNNEESRAQIQLFRWWHTCHMIAFGLPEELLHSVPNGGFRGIITATIMKREGQKRGVFDVKLNVARKGHHGLWLEMKAKGGVLSDAQAEFRVAVMNQGYDTAVCYSADDAIKTITEYLT